MVISTLDLLVIALSAWRLAFMLVKEEGPFHIFERARARFALGGLLTCVYCASVWTAALSWGLLQTSLAPIIYILAASGLALMLQRYVGFDHS